MNLDQYLIELGSQARSAAKAIAVASTAQKNHALRAIAAHLRAQTASLLVENAKDMQAGEVNGLSEAMLDRLKLTPARIEDMAAGVEQVADLPDPIGQMFDFAYRPSGIQVGKMRVPLGVVFIIYESRPNVTADAAALCLKSGNAAILRGGKEAFYSNQAIALCVKMGLKQANLPEELIQVPVITDRELTNKLMQSPQYIDVIVPRGGKGLVQAVSDHARVPVIKHLDGICHVYIDEFAALNKAEHVAFNAKCQRYGTCNTMETLLVHQNIAESILPKLSQRYIAQQVALRGCEKTIQVLHKHGIDNISLATEIDWQTEYLAPILSIKVVENFDEAIAHIQQYSSQHTDSIITENYTHSQRFIREIDSSSVMVNASTRFADGFEYGLGAEIGISTDKFHARGPVGLEGLTSVKWVVFGNGQGRGDVL